MALTAIFDESDWAVYAPTCTLSWDARQSAALFLQAIVEGTEGANRPLALTQFEEVLSTGSNSQPVGLSYLPIATSPVPVIEYRGSHQTNRYYRSSGVGTWQDVAANSYVLDYRTGHLNLFPQWSDGFGRRGANPAVEVKAVYTAGYDFASTTDYDVVQIKALFGQLLTYCQSPQFNNLVSVEVFQEVKVTHAQASMDSAIAGLPRSMLLPFRKYRPRGT